MLLTQFKNFSIIGMAVAAPEQLITVETFNETFGEDVVANISSMTGIKSFRRTLPEQTASDLGFAAARNLLENKNINLQDIGILIFVTQKPDYRIPSTAFVIHKRLGLTKDCSCFDINLACSGFVYGLHTAMSMLNHSDKKTALLITGDTTTKTISPYDRTMMLLFGDSGTATLIKKTDSKKEAYTALRTDGERFKAIITPSGAFRNRNAPLERVPWSDDISRSDYDTHMKGMDVFGFSITDVPKLMKEMMEELGTSPETYDCFALHQPNMYMLKKIAQKIKIPQEKLLISIDRFGNNSSSSIPLVLSDHYGDKDQGNLRTFMCGFGSGLSWGCADIEMEAKNILPIIYSDEYYIEETKK
jgi:3-oxoacyl-[acyl-carrier-protein] synthase III